MFAAAPNMFAVAPNMSGMTQNSLPAIANMSGTASKTAAYAQNARSDPKNPSAPPLLTPANDPMSHRPPAEPPPSAGGLPATMTGRAGNPLPAVAGLANPTARTE